MKFLDFLEANKKLHLKTDDLRTTVQSAKVDHKINVAEKRLDVINVAIAEREHELRALDNHIVINQKQLNDLLDAMTNNRLDQATLKIKEQDER